MPTSIAPVEVTPLSMFFERLDVSVADRGDGTWEVATDADISQEELDACVSDATDEALAIDRAATLQTRLRSALTHNSGYLAKTSYTNADVVEQSRQLTRQMNGLIRLHLREFGDISDA